MARPTPRTTLLGPLALSGALALVAAGCASTGVTAPAVPLPEDRVFEVGAKASGEFGLAQARAGPAGYFRTSIDTPVIRGGELELLGAVVANADAAYGPLYPQQNFDLPTFGGGIGAAGVGARANYRLLPALVVGMGLWGEAGVLFDPASGPASSLAPYASGSITVPVAERLYEDLWVYARPTARLTALLGGQLGGITGIDIAALGVTGGAPFFGEISCPVGLGLYLLDGKLGLFGEAGYHFASGGPGLTFAISYAM